MAGCGFGPDWGCDVTPALDETETHFLKPIHLEPGPDFASLPLPCVIHLRRFRNRPLFIFN